MVIKASLSLLFFALGFGVQGVHEFGVEDPWQLGAFLPSVCAPQLLQSD